MDRLLTLQLPEPFLVQIVSSQSTPTSSCSRRFSQLSGHLPVQEQQVNITIVLGETTVEGKLRSIHATPKKTTLRIVECSLDALSNLATPIE